MQPVGASEGRIGNGDRVNLKLRNFHENFGTVRNQLAWLLHHNDWNDDANGNPDPEYDPDRQFGNRVGDSARDPWPLHEGHLDQTPVTRLALDGACRVGRLFARAGPGVLQPRLALLLLLALRFADKKRSASNVLRFIKLVCCFRQKNSPVLKGFSFSL